MAVKHKDHRYIEALVENDARVLSELYQRFTPKVQRYISKNNGSYDDAQDIIQESLITIYHQAVEKKLLLTCPFDAYFFLICKRKWLNELRKKGHKEVTFLDEITSISKLEMDQVEDTMLYEQKRALIATMFLQLGLKCQEIIKAAFTLKSMEKVAEKLGITYGYARKKKSQCIGQLTKLVRNTAEFDQLKND
ncbi:MAG: RNA polymerase subunit sigma-24 [Flavobacteriaceae bacterium]|nr:MAG: RNA polymerase subunit sigma-24 [Flavobacteriaceae bacterium]